MQNQFVDLYRNGIKNATEAVRAGLETTAQLQQHQLDFVRNVLDENSRSANQLSEARSLEQVMEWQSRMAGAQLERWTEFWSNWWRDAYALTTRAAEQGARSGANQMSNFGGALREAGNQQQERKGHEQQHRKSA